MKFARWNFTCAALIGLICSLSAAFGQESKAKIRIAIPSPSICCLHLFAAQEWRIFENSELEVEIVSDAPADRQCRDGCRRSSLFRRGRSEFSSCDTKGHVFQSGLVRLRSAHLFAARAAGSSDIKRTTNQAARGRRFGRHDRGIVADRAGSGRRKFQGLSLSLVLAMPIL